jgi:hypothetical protein
VAAIKPHLAQDGETSELQSRYWECAGSALGDLAGEVCPAPEEIAQEAHAELLNVAWIRQALVEKMQGRKIWIQYDRDGEPSIAVDKPVGGPAWNPSSGSRATTILGWTTKMGAPSFSLPAGAAAMGGACPGAAAGQSVVSAKSRKELAPGVLKVLNEYRGNNPVVDQIKISRTVCEFCYAEGGQYATSGVQNAQLMRYAWAKRAVGRPGHAPGVHEFYSVMLDAIDHADFKLGDEPDHFKSEGMRFFRLHDSGDFFSISYFMEWKKITLYYHHKVGGEGLKFNPDGTVAEYGKGHPQPIWFWAPSRGWMTKLLEVIASENSTAKHGDNFAIRPSAYHINEHGPLFTTDDRENDGWAAASTVYDYKHKKEGHGRAFNWDCQAYAAEKGPSCRGAESNPKGPGKGAVGCRECWLNKKSAVNYTLHL